MAYSESYYINATGFDLITGLNYAADYWIGFGFLLTIFVLIFLWLRQTYGDVQEAFFTSMVVTTTIALFLVLADLITWWMFFGAVVLCGVAIVFHLFRGTSTNA